MVNPIQDDVRGGGGGVVKSPPPPPASFFPVTSTKVRISRPNFPTFNFNLFTTMV